MLLHGLSKLQKLQKLLSGTFQHPLEPSKGSKPSQQLSTAFRCFAMELFLLGFETAIWHVFQHPLNPQNPPSSFRRPTFAALPWDLPRPHELFLLGFETAIWHFRSATSCFYWASKLLSGTFSAPLKTFKTLKTLAAAFDGLSLLCHGSSRGPTSCFCWASKLLSGTSEAPQAVSSVLRNCYLARFHLKTLEGLKTFAAAFGFYWASKLLSGTFSAPLKTHITLKTLPAASDGLSLLCHGSSRGPTSCFCWASQLLSGTSEAPQAFSIGLRLGFETASWHVFSLKPSKASKPSQQLSVSIGLQNCYLARFSAPL